MKKSLRLLTLIFFSFAMPVFAVNYYWAGGGANANWTTVGNWRTGSETGTVATAYPTTGDTAFVAGDYTVTIDEDITVAALNIQKSGAAQFVVTDWTTKFTGSKKLTFGDMDFNRASSTDGVIGTLEIDCEAECTGTLFTHSGTKLLVDGGKKLEAATLTHSASNSTPKSLIQVDGTLEAGTIDLQGGPNVGCNALKVSSGGTVTSTNLTWSTNDNYTNTAYPAIDNAGTITLSGNLNATGPASNTGTLKTTGGTLTFKSSVENTGTISATTGDVTFAGAVTGAGGTISTTSGNITASAADASALGKVQSSGGTISNTGSGAVTLAELQMGADTSVTNSTGGALAITKLTGNRAATLTGGTNAITVSSFDGSPSVTVAAGSCALGTGTIAALTVNASASATIAGALTVTGDISNAGTLATNAALTFASDFTNTGTFTQAAGTTVTATGASASFTGNGASLPNFVYAPAATSGTGLAITDTNTITNFSCATANAKIAVNAANSFGTFSATGAGASITLSGAGAFANLSVTSGGGSLTVNAAQTITGNLTLKGTGTGANVLAVTGTGSLNIASNQSAGEYLSVAHTGPAIGGGSYFYTAGNSSFAAAPLYGQDKGWIFLDSPAEFVWTGATSADWAAASNWNYNMVPGLAGSAGVPATVGYPVKIPSAANQPELSGSVSYSISDLTIDTAAASLTLSSTGNVAASGTLTNKGTIYYPSTGRVTNETGTFINDNAQGTVEFTSASGAADLASVQYYNLTINGSGTYTAAGDLTVKHDLKVLAGNTEFNGATSAMTAAFSAGTTISLGDTADDSFTVTGGALDLPDTLGGLSLAGTITASGGITLGHNAVLNANTKFASATSLDAPVNLTGAFTVTTNAALTTSSTNTLTLTNASLENAAAVTDGNIIFEGTTAQSFTPNAASTYQSVTINKTASQFTANAALKAANLSITQSADAMFNGLVTVLTAYADTATAGSIAFNAGCDFTPAATFNTTGMLRLNGAPTACSFAGGLEHTAGSTFLRGALNATDAAITLGATTLAAATTINAGSGAVSINGPLIGAASLTSNGSGALTFGGAVGTPNALAAITVAGPAIVTAPSIRTSGAQEYKSDLTFNADCTVTGPVKMTGAAATLGGTGKATIADFAYAPTDTTGTGLAVAGSNTFTNFTCSTDGAKIAVNAANSFGTFSATGAGASITLSGESAFTNLSVTSGGGTLAVNAAQTVTTLALKGTTGSPLNVTGTGSIALASNQNTGNYLSVAYNGASIGGNYYSAKNSTFDAAPYYGERNHWILLNDAMLFVWTGKNGTDWGTASNWNYNLIPGTAVEHPGVDTKIYPVLIPDAPSGVATNFPVVTKSDGYSIKNLSIGENVSSPAKLTVQTGGNDEGAIKVSGSLENYGTIIYNRSGRITKSSTFINDADENHKGTVEFATGSAAADLANVAYYNLIVSGNGAFSTTAGNTLTVKNDMTYSGGGSLTVNDAANISNNLTISGTGTFTANAALTVTNALAVSGGNALFNNGTRDTTTSAATAAFTTTGSVSLGNTAGDNFKITGGTLTLPQTLGDLTLAGTVTASGGITLSKDAALAAGTTFASATSLGAPVNLTAATGLTVTTNAALTTSATNTLTLTNASLVNTGAVTGGHIIFAETTLKPHQVFTPNTASTYQSVTINKTSGGEFTVNQALNATDFTVTKNGTLTTSAAVNATNFTISDNNVYVANAALAAGSLTITKNGNATFNELATVTASYADTAAAGSIRFAKGCAFTFASPATTFNTTGTLTLNGATNACAFTGGLTHTAGSTSLYGTLNTANAAITLGATSIDAATTIATNGGAATFGATSLNANLAVNSGAGTATFQGTVDGAFALVSNGSGLLTLNGAVGGTTPPTQLTAAGPVAINAATKINGPITGSDSAAINAATSATTIMVDGAATSSAPSIMTSGLQLYKDNLTFTAPCAVTGTVQAAANVATSAAVTATFANDLWLYTSAAAALGGSGGSLSIAGNLFFAGASKNAAVASNVTAKNVLLLHGTVDIGSAATLSSSSGDMVLLGAAYDIDDDKDGAAASQVAGLFAYNHASRKKAASYTAALPTACPDGTTISQTWSGAVTTNAGAKISAGQNFYANGLSSLGSGAWTLTLPNNDAQTSAFAEIYNSTVTNCSANYNVAAAERNTVTSCSKIITARPMIKEAWTVYDDAIYISFKDSNGADILVENSNNEISAACSSVFNSAGAFAGTYIDADCQSPTNGKGDIAAFYIKSNNKWKTDADGTTVGAAESSNRAGDSSSATIPYLNLPKALAGVYETLRDSSKNRIAHYYSETPDTSAASAVAGKTFTAVADKCSPVLIQVLTGQELHEDPAAQKDYDAHNFVEFVYSEPVDISGGSTSVLDSDVNIQAAVDLGATTNGSGVTFAGLAAAAGGKVEAALKTGSGSPHSLYRLFSRSAGAAAQNQAARVRVSIAGYVDGTVSTASGTFKNWTGYISSASLPSGSITRISNAFIKDKSPAKNSLAIDSTAGHALPTLLVQSAESELYGPWDVTPPNLAPVRINGTNVWAKPATDASQEYEIVGASYATGTLSAIELHWFDNEPTYTENRQWFSRVGWADASSPTEYASISSYAADARGGSRPDSSSGNATKGGIRYCSLYNANNAFNYAIDGTSVYYNFTQNIKGGAESSLFTYAGDDPGAPSRGTGAEDGLYCKLMLDQTGYNLQTTFVLNFDSNACHVTDLAGNRIQCGKISVKSIDRTPPAFTMSAVPLGTKQMLVIFSKAINTGTLVLYSDPSTHVSVPALDYIPKSLELTSASGTGMQVDHDIPATCLFKTTNATGFVITLKQNAVLDDITKGVFITAKSQGYNYDPLSGIITPMTYIQDTIGNCVVDNSQHAFSDFAVNAVQPQYAYDNSLTDAGAATGYGLYKEGSWAVRDWNAEQENYGTLSAEKEIIMQTTLYDGTSDKSGGLDPSSGQIALGKITAFFDASPDPNSVSAIINKNSGKSWRIWHPNFTDDAFTSLALVNNAPQFSIDGNANDSGVVFDISKELSSANWKSDDQVSFLFKMGDYTVDHFANGTAYPLYAVRLKDPNDITSLDLWSFKIRTTSLQRGGVSILNNVIDLNNGEHTVIQVDMKQSGNLNVIVMTLDGNIVTYLRHGHTDAGTHYYNWNGTNNGGSKVARGLYFVRVIGPGIDETRKVMCVK